METNFYVKSHGLGNCYIVIDFDNINFELTDMVVKRICDLHFGVGSNGILVKVPSNIADFGLKIFNTDASIAENCGNGLRIFSKYLHDYGYLSSDTFTVDIFRKTYSLRDFREKCQRQSHQNPCGHGQGKFYCERSSCKFLKRRMRKRTC